MASTKTINCGPHCPCAQRAASEISLHEAGPSVMLPKRRFSVNDNVRPLEQILQVNGEPQQDALLEPCEISDTLLIRKMVHCEIVPSVAKQPEKEVNWPLRNAKFDSLGLAFDCVWPEMKLDDIVNCTKQIVYFDNSSSIDIKMFAKLRTNNYTVNAGYHPPQYTQPDPPHGIFAAKILDAKELTNPGAYKKTFHMCLDVSDYPLAQGQKWITGGCFGVFTPNSWFWVNPLLDRLSIENPDEPVLMKTNGGRWPTVWDEDKPRELWVTRRDLLKWSVDFMSQPPTKQLLRLLSEYAQDEDEKLILLYLCSAQGSENFLKIKDRYVTLLQLLEIFESSTPPLDKLVSNLPQLIARWFSLANDIEQSNGILEFAFTVNKIPDWIRGERHGVGTTYLEDLCKEFLKCKETGCKFEKTLPIFRGLQMNPFTRTFQADTPMILIGAGVGIAPFRGFVQRRLQNSSCAGKVWIIQGCRDVKLDDLYQDEWGVGSILNLEKKEENYLEEKMTPFRFLAESQAGKSAYVQDEIIAQSGLIWKVITAPKGQVYLCGAGQEFCLGVEKALAEAVAKEGGLSFEQAEQMWKEWADPKVSKYIKEVW